MKNDPWIGTLIGVLGLCTLVFLGLVYLFIAHSRDVRALQPQVAAINARRTVAMALGNEVLEYSKQHPDILEYTGLKPTKPSTPAPTTPNKSK